MSLNTVTLMHLYIINKYDVLRKGKKKTFTSYVYNLQLWKDLWYHVNKHMCLRFLSQLFTLSLTNDKVPQLLTWKSFLHSAIIWARP